MTDTQTLKCPSCGESTGLHHTDVEVFPRPDEYGFYPSVKVRSDGSVVEGSGTNPSARRDGIRISLWCEHCHEEAAICIAQYKGEELMWGEKY